MAKLPNASSKTSGRAAENALALAAQGIRVFPCHHTIPQPESLARMCTCKAGPDCKSPGKHPRTKQGVIEATADLTQIATWIARYPGANWGQDLTGRAVVDIDTAGGKKGEQTWLGIHRDEHEDDPPTLEYRTGRGGRQLIYTLPPDLDTADLDVHLGQHVDFKRGTGSYAMVPGSITDHHYEVVVDEPTQPCPEWIIDLARNRKHKPVPGAKPGKTTGRAILTELLALPKEDPTKGDDWTIRVAGHLVKGVRHEDALYALMRILVDDGMVDPLDDATLLKKVRSALKMQEQHYADATTENGYLEGHATSITIEAKEGEMVFSHEYLDCGVVARLIVDDGDQRFYRLEVTGHASSEPKYITVAPADLVDIKKRNALFAGLGYTFDVPQNPLYKMTETARMVRFIQSQKPPQGRAVGCLGWHGDAGFLVADGVLTPEGLVEFRDVIPHPDAVKQSAHEYGDLVSEEKALSVLREVATFQVDQVSAVALSWWVMCLLKGRYRASIAPILYVDATSGSGKTNGFFAFLVALAGNTTGAGTITPPRIKAQLGANRNGVVWVDDVSAVGDSLRDTFRQAASKGSHTKTDTRDNVSSIAVHMVGNILVSCEGLGRMMHEKAMRDRVIHLKVPSVKGRASLKDPERPQWDDILDLLNEFGADGEDYSAFARTMAGTLVRAVHRRAEDVQEVLSRHRAGLSGRHAEKHAILRAGAELLERLLGQEGAQEAVRQWCTGDTDQGEVNLFVGEIAPRLMRELDFPETATQFDGKAAPIWADDDTVYVSPALCADHWSGLRDTSERDRQLGSKEAIVAELQACGLTARSSRKEARNRAQGWKVSYWTLPPELSSLVLRLAHGD